VSEGWVVRWLIRQSNYGEQFQHAVGFLERGRGGDSARHGKTESSERLPGIERETPACGWPEVVTALMRLVSGSKILHHSLDYLALTVRIHFFICLNIQVLVNF
jgi:hypothetical protein